MREAEGKGTNPTTANKEEMRVMTKGEERTVAEGRGANTTVTKATETTSITTQMYRDGGEDMKVLEGRDRASDGRRGKKPKINLFIGDGDSRPSQEKRSCCCYHETDLFKKLS